MEIRSCKASSYLILDCFSLQLMSCNVRCARRGFELKEALLLGACKVASLQTISLVNFLMVQLGLCQIFLTTRPSFFVMQALWAPRCGVGDPEQFDRGKEISEAANHASAQGAPGSGVRPHLMGCEVGDPEQLSDSEKAMPDLCEIVPKKGGITSEAGLGELPDGPTCVMPDLFGDQAIIASGKGYDPPSEEGDPATLVSKRKRRGGKRKGASEQPPGKLHGQPVNSAFAPDLDGTTDLDAAVKVVRLDPPCKFYAIGKCKRGQRCAFAHSIADKEPPDGFVNDKSGSPVARQAPSGLSSGDLSRGSKDAGARGGMPGKPIAHQYSENDLPEDFHCFRGRLSQKEIDDIMAIEAIRLKWKRASH